MPEPQSKQEAPGNGMVPRERIDEFSDPSGQGVTPRPVGAEPRDPDSGSMLSNREFTMLSQAKSLLNARRV